MNAITLKRKDLAPFENVEGSVSWQLESEPRNLELRLFWFTRGRGSEDAEGIQVLALGDTRNGTRDFSFTLPGEPWSVSGKLVSITWALELVEKKAGGLALEEFTVAPARREIRLAEVAEPKSETGLSRWARLKAKR